MLEAGVKPLTTDDVVAIQQLHARHFQALDGVLPGDNAQAWASTFTANGTFRLETADGSVVMSVSGRDQLAEAWKSFPDISTTRHWTNNLMVEAAPHGATTRNYICALDIGRLPALLIRSGIYTDELVREDGQWRFSLRVLHLDANSPKP